MGAVELIGSIRCQFVANVGNLNLLPPVLPMEVRKQRIVFNYIPSERSNSVILSKNILTGL